MNRLRGLMKMLSGVLTPAAAAFAALAGAVLLSLLILFSVRPAFLPVLAVLMALLWRWGARFDPEDAATIDDDKPENP